MKFPFSLNIENEKETENAACTFAKVIEKGDVIALNGNLGSGKTFFVKSLCKQFGIMNVSSPSFAIINSYLGEIEVNHFDFYRIKNVAEIYDIGFDEYLNNDSVNFIEWAEMYQEVLPNSYYSVSIEMFNGTKRKIVINKIG